MIELKLKFNTLKEVSDFIAKSGDVNAVNGTITPVTSVEVTHPPVIPLMGTTESASTEVKLTPAQKAAATRAKKKAAKEALLTASPMSVENTAASVMQPVQATVEAPALVQAPAPVSSLDRGPYIARAQELIAAMKALGVQDIEVLPKLQEVYARSGVSWAKVSDLSDADLPNIVHQIDLYVQSLSQAPTPSYV